MGLDVTIKNKQLFKKPLKPDDLRMGKYKIGAVDEYGRISSKFKPGGDLAVYDPDRIGRGIMVSGWSDNVKNSIDLRVNYLCTKYDMEMFYAIIRNIMHVWKAKTFEQDGCEYSEAQIDEQCQEQKRSSMSFLSSIDRMTGEKKSDFVTISGAIFPLDLDVQILKKFGTEGDEEGYAKYLHELQSKDLYYAVPLIYKNKHEPTFFGNFAITSDTPSIVPLVPKAPPMFKDSETGKGVECAFYVVSFFSYAQKKVVGRMSYDDFKRLAELENCEMFDKTHVILPGISEKAMEEMMASEHEDPLKE